MIQVYITQKGKITLKKFQNEKTLLNFIHEQKAATTISKNDNGSWNVILD